MPTTDYATPNETGKTPEKCEINQQFAQIHHTKIENRNNLWEYSHI